MSCHNYITIFAQEWIVRKFHASTILFRRSETRNIFHEFISNPNTAEINRNEKLSIVSKEKGNNNSKETFFCSL